MMLYIFYTDYTLTLYTCQEHLLKEPLLLDSGIKVSIMTIYTQIIHSCYLG